MIKTEFESGYGKFLSIPSVPQDWERNYWLSRPKFNSKQRSTTKTKHETIQQAICPQTATYHFVQMKTNSYSAHQVQPKHGYEAKKEYNNP